MTAPDLHSTVISCRKELACDIVVINTGMDAGVDVALRNQVHAIQDKRDHVIAILVTEGGLADVAYRCARILQANYEKVSICIPGWCKSAGTLFALGANELLIGDRGELGPLDVQIAVRDEIGDRNSGLILQSALESMQEESFKLFETHMMNIKARSGNLVTFKTAADLAVQLAVGLMKPIFEQIDPVRLGDDARSQKIGYEYGVRLNLHSQNLQSDSALMQLLYGYPSHSFVIDRSEAESLFRNVKPIDGIVSSLIECLGDIAHAPQQQSIVVFLNGEPGEEKAANDGDDSPTQGSDELDIAPEDNSEVGPSGELSGDLPERSIGKASRGKRKPGR